MPHTVDAVGNVLSCRVLPEWAAANSTMCPKFQVPCQLRRRLRFGYAALPTDLGRTMRK